MNEVGWLPAKNSPLGNSAEPQKSGSRKGKGESFAAFLSGADSGEVQDQRPARPAVTYQRAPATFPQDGDEPSLGSNRKGNHPVFFAASQNRQAVYSAAPQVSDEAIAFNARPIVGPASFNHTPGEVLTALSDANDPALAAARADLRASLGSEGGYVVILADRAGTGAQPNAAPSGVTAPLPASVPAPVPGKATALVRGLPAAQSDTIVQPLTGASSAKANPQSEPSPSASNRTSSSAPALPVNIASTHSPAFAQILASPGEYRLVIRGQRLSEDMREHVLRAVRSGLAEFGLPSMPVSIFEPEGDR